ncbi:hypothetical protein BCI9360_02989 [Bacillus sp. CECT 9360]|nr:hypothetical protein BCI9360_02989 [Bacillus sp. CECT 9360]
MRLEHIKNPLGMILNVRSLPAKGLIKNQEAVHVKNNTVIGSAVSYKEFLLMWLSGQPMQGNTLIY